MNNGNPLIPTKVFLAYPYSGTAKPEATLSALRACRDPDCCTFHPLPGPAGSHCENFNKGWCMALNTRRTKGWTHFAMIHSDVEAEPFWLDKMLAEMDRVGADVLSAVLPIKDMRGVTSTAFFDADNFYNERLTMRELEHLPNTFDGDTVRKYRLSHYPPGWTGRHLPWNPHLLISSGMWVARFTEPWVEQVWFEMRDRIARLPPDPAFPDQPEGRFVAFNFSEDWNFSLQCHEWGLKLFSTKIIQAWHHGGFEYDNGKAWGKWSVDEDGSYGEWLRDLPGMKSRKDDHDQRLPVDCLGREGRAAAGAVDSVGQALAPAG